MKVQIFYFILILTCSVLVKSGPRPIFWIPGMKPPWWNQNASPNDDGVIGSGGFLVGATSLGKPSGSEVFPYLGRNRRAEEVGTSKRKPQIPPISRRVIEEQMLLPMRWG